MDEIGSEICLTMRITSSIVVLMEGGKRPLRLPDARFKNLAGRYHFRARRFLRLVHRVSSFSLTSSRCRISPDKRICPLPTQERPVTGMPLSLPSTTSWMGSSQSQRNLIVNGLPWSKSPLAVVEMAFTVFTHSAFACP